MNQKRIVCLAVDDEPLALSVLAQYIGTIPALQLAGSCADALQALELLEHHPVDLIFLDIQMPLIMGTEFIRTLKKTPKIIFTTAFREYAVEGFELNAVDYLLKPISFERFLKAVNRVLQTEIPIPESTYRATENLEESPAGCIYVRANRKMVRILLNDILYVEGLSDYVKIVTPGGTIVTKQLISSLEETLPADRFVRVHRSFIVALTKIDAYNAEFVQIGPAKLPIGRLFRQLVGQRLRDSSASLPRAAALLKKAGKK